MLKKRIIPCLDVKDGRTVKGTNFIDLKDAGDSVELAKKYVEQGADELVFLDITATVEGRKTFVSLVERIAEAINIPFTVGGGINSPKDAETVIRAGADKVSVNSAAVKNPGLISEVAANFGKQCTVVAIDTKYIDNVWQVFVNGGRTPTGINTVEWALTAEKLGAGEILLTSMNNDGVRNGFAIDITGEVSAALNIPVIASGGAGKSEDFFEVFHTTKASAGLAAGIFHFGIVDIADLKDCLHAKSIAVRRIKKRESENRMSWK
jgi:cyclase